MAKVATANARKRRSLLMPSCRSMASTQTPAGTNHVNRKVARCAPAFRARPGLVRKIEYKEKHRIDQGLGHEENRHTECGQQRGHRDRNQRPAPVHELTGHRLHGDEGEAKDQRVDELRRVRGSPPMRRVATAGEVCRPRSSSRAGCRMRRERIKIDGYRLRRFTLAK